MRNSFDFTAWDEHSASKANTSQIAAPNGSFSGVTGD
jgi:hypothetical protein